MKNSNSVFSEDNFFICGLYALLGRDFIDNFFTVVDFDYQDKNVLFIPLPEHKDSVTFVSNDFAFYKAERCGIHYALDKKSSIRDILSFFLFKRNSGNYQARQKLSPREKEVLELISEGASFQEMVEKLGINSKTLYTHRRNLVMKLGCDNRVSLLNLVLQRQV